MHKRPAWHFSAGLALLVLGASLCAAQSATTQPDGPVTIAIDGTDDTLWLSASGPKESFVFRRGVSQEFDLGVPIGGRIARMASGGADLFVFLADGTFYRLSDGEWQRAADAPQRSIPLETAYHRDILYTLLDSAIADQLPQYAMDASADEWGPFETTNASLILARYDGVRWSGMVPLPLSVTVESSPRLLVDQGRIVLFWSGGEGQLHFSAYNVAEASWENAGTLAVPQHRGFRVFSIGRTPVVAALAARADRFRVYRLLGNLEQPSIVAVEPRTTALPEGVPSGAIQDVVPFGQQLAVLEEIEREAYLRFATLAGAPVGSSEVVSEVLASPQRRNNLANLVQLVMLAVLIGLLTALFVLRKNAIHAPLVLPSDMQVAFTMQRLAAFLIDFVPFVLIFARVTDVNPGEGFGKLLEWGVGSGRLRNPLLGQDLVLWWGSAVLAHTVYATVMEALTGRTVGKTLLSIRVQADSGQRPIFWQVLVRNVVRLIELVPSFWILMFLVVLSRNRQRLGDLFAKTVVVRRRPPEASVENDGDEREE